MVHQTTIALSGKGGRRNPPNSPTLIFGPELDRNVIHFNISNEPLNWLGPNPMWELFFSPWYPCVCTPLNLVELIKFHTWKHFTYPTYVKNTNPDVHIHVFKKEINVNGETINDDIIDTKR
jgi:hypothetical protein